jgi:nicotinamide-nucleotide amidase
MAKQARKISGADYAIAITGIAGPTGATEQKPLGLVYISVDSSGGSETRRFVFPNNRELIRFRSAQTALNMLRLKMRV